jgi:hypothetical protein
MQNPSLHGAPRQFTQAPPEPQSDDVVPDTHCWVVMSQHPVVHAPTHPHVCDDMQTGPSELASQSAHEPPLDPHASLVVPCTHVPLLQHPSWQGEAFEVPHRGEHVPFVQAL